MSWFEIAKTTAAYVMSYLSDQQQALRLASQVADKLEKNNKIIFEEVAHLVRREFSTRKLEQCQNLAQSIATFLSEYSDTTNLDYKLRDRDKLFLIETKAGELLDILNDPDIKIVGISTWMIVAAIRILALRERSNYDSSYVIISRKRALEYSRYVESMKTELKDAVSRRFGEVIYSQPSPSNILDPYSGKYYYLIDQGTENQRPCAFLYASSNKEEVQNNRANEIKSLLDKPLSSMQKCIEEWRHFSAFLPLEEQHYLGGDTLISHREVPEGSYLVSTDSRYKMVIQGDGNLVVYGPDQVAIWASNSAYIGVPPFFLAMQSDGNLVVYGEGTTRVWAHDQGLSEEPKEFKVVMQSDSNLVVRGPGDNAIWDTLHAG